MRLPTSSAKDLRRWRYIQSCSSLCRRVMFYGTSDRDSSSRSQQSLRSRTASARRRIRGRRRSSSASRSPVSASHPCTQPTRARGLVNFPAESVRRREKLVRRLCRVQSVRALREIPLPHYPVCSNSVCFVSWGTLPRVAPSEIVSAPPELHIIDISPSIRMIDYPRCVHRRFGRCCTARLTTGSSVVNSTVPASTLRSPSAPSDQLGKGSASVAIYPKLFQPLSLGDVLWYLREDASSRSQQSLRSRTASARRRIRGRDVHPRRHVVRSRRLIHVRSRLELGGLVASRQSPVRRREKLVRRLCRVQSVRALREIPLPHYPVCSNFLCFVSWGTLPRVAPSEIVSAPPELHIIDISPSISIMKDPRYDHRRFGRCCTAARQPVRRW